MSTLCMSQCDPPFEKSWLRPCDMGQARKSHRIVCSLSVFSRLYLKVWTMASMQKGSISDPLYEALLGSKLKYKLCYGV